MSCTSTYLKVGSNNYYALLENIYMWPSFLFLENGHMFYFPIKHISAPTTKNHKVHMHTPLSHKVAQQKQGTAADPCRPRRDDCHAWWCTNRQGRHDKQPNHNSTRYKDEHTHEEEKQEKCMGQQGEDVSWFQKIKYSYVHKKSTTKHYDQISRKKKNAKKNISICKSNTQHNVPPGYEQLC